MGTARFTEQLWYENADGETWVPPPAGNSAPPEGFVYQHSQFARWLAHTVLLVEDGRSRRIVSGESSYPADLVLAMVRPSIVERALQVLRYGWPAPRLTYTLAVLRAANNCERCMNAAAHRYGLRWGYRAGSDEWTRARTSCGLCSASNEVAQP